MSHKVAAELERELGETVIPIALEGLTGMGILTEGASPSFMDALPDPVLDEEQDTELWRQWKAVTSSRAIRPARLP